MTASATANIKNANPFIVCDLLLDKIALTYSTLSETFLVVLLTIVFKKYFVPLFLLIAD